MNPATATIDQRQKGMENEVFDLKQKRLWHGESFDKTTLENPQDARSKTLFNADTIKNEFS